MGKLAESYVEFFAKGLEEVERQTKETAANSEHAHKAVMVLSGKFKELYDSVLKKGIATADTLFQNQKKMDDLFRKNEGLSKFIEKSKVSEKLNDTINKQLQLQIQKVQAGSREFISLAASESTLNEKVNQAAKSMDLQVSKMQLASGATSQLMRAQIALEREQNLLAKAEQKAFNVAKYGTVIGGLKNIKESFLGAGGAVDKFSERMKKVGATALIAGAAVSGAVGMLVRSASSGTVEGEHLSKAFEVLSRTVGDMFAPYVRMATELVNKLTSYWNSLSGELKDSVARWGIVIAALTAFVGLIPVAVTAITTLGAAIAAITSPIGLVGAAIIGLGAYLAGAFDGTKSWEDVLANFIAFFMDTWDQAVSIFEKAMTAIQEAYDTYMAPLVESLIDLWTEAKDAISDAVSYVGELIAGFFGTSIEDASTFQGVMTAVVEAWLDLQVAAETVIEALSEGFMFIYDNAVKPVIDLILTGFKTVWGYIKQVAEGIFGSFNDATGGIMESVGGAIKWMFSSWKNFVAVVVSLVFQIVKAFAVGVNKISELWWGMINKLAKAAAWVLEKLGIINEETAKKMKELGKGNTDIFDTDAMQKKMDGMLDRLTMKLEDNKQKAKEIGKEIANFVGAAAGPEIQKKVEENAIKARGLAKAVVGMFTGIKDQGKGDGFKIKGTVAFEGFQNTFDRLQQAFASNTGQNVEQAQLGEMKAMNQNLQVAAGALVQIKDKIPAVR